MQKIRINWSELDEPHDGVHSHELQASISLHNESSVKYSREQLFFPSKLQICTYIVIMRVSISLIFCVILKLDESFDWDENDDGKVYFNK